MMYVHRGFFTGLIFFDQFIKYLLCDYRHGAEEVEPSASGAAGGSRSQAFQGRAYRLGDSEATSEVVNAVAAAHPPHHRQVVSWRRCFCNCQYVCAHV